MGDTVLAQLIATQAFSLQHVAPERLKQIEDCFGGPGPFGDLAELAEWCSQHPAQALDLLASLQDALR